MFALTSLCSHWTFSESEDRRKKGGKTGEKREDDAESRYKVDRIVVRSRRASEQAQRAKQGNVGWTGSKVIHTVQMRVSESEESLRKRKTKKEKETGARKVKGKMKQNKIKNTETMDK